MGWLRDLMAASDPPLRSFGKVAQVALIQSDWPTEIQIQPRSLASLLSKLDHGEQLSWLADRPNVQALLGRVLSAPPTEMARVLAGTERREGASGSWLRLRDLPGARPVDLLSEALPPAFPEPLLGPRGGPLWWVAPRGAGRTLLGRWLAARGRAAAVRGASWDAVRERVPDGPVFVELEEADAGGSAPEARAALVIAAPFEPPAGSAFERVESPPLGSILEAVLRWAAERLPRDTRFQPDLALPAIASAVEQGVLGSLGAVLGVVGAIDELGVREQKQLSLERLARRFVDARLARALDPAAPHAGWLRRAFQPSLLTLVERALVDSDRPLEAARSFDEWLALAPPELERAVDVEWMRLSLGQIESPIRGADLERAARRLPPGAFRFVATLESAKLLVRDESDRGKLEPIWLWDVLRARAVTSLVERSPFEWGEALLRPHAAPEIAAALLERTLALGSSALEPVLDLEAEDQPAYVAAVDLSVRVAGIARLLGAELGQEVLDGLWEESQRLALALPGMPPEPRIDLLPPSAPVPRRGRERGRALLELGSFYLGALALSETRQARSTRLAALDPWHLRAPPPELEAVYDAIQASLAGKPPWQRAAFLLVARVKSSVGRAGGGESLHALERPVEMVDEIQHGVLSWDTLGGEHHREWLDALLGLAEQRELPPSEIASALWAAWDAAGRPDAEFLAPTADEHPLFWRHVPGELLDGLLADARRHAVPYAVFGDEQWQAFERATRRTPELVADARAWEAMPAETALALIASPLAWHGAEAAVRVLWRRFPELLQKAVQRNLDAGMHTDVESLEALLGAAPHADAAALIAELWRGDPLRALRVSALPPVRQLLHRLIRERAPAWRDAYRALSLVERELRRVGA